MSGESGRRGAGTGSMQRRGVGRRKHAEAAEQHQKPQPTPTIWAIGSMEWLAEQPKSG
jgi:hypothetical protein